MIPNIGIMIGGYIIFRCLEIACRSNDSFFSRGARNLVLIAAVIGMVMTGFLMVDLFMSSLTSTVSTQP